MTKATHFTTGTAPACSNGKSTAPARVTTVHADVTCKKCRGGTAWCLSLATTVSAPAAEAR